MWKINKFSNYLHGLVNMYEKGVQYDGLKSIGKSMG